MWNYRFKVEYKKRSNSKPELLCETNNYFYALRVFNVGLEKGIYGLILISLTEDLKEIINIDVLKTRKVK